MHVHNCIHTYIRWDENLFQSFYKFQIICLSVTQLILGMHDISIWVFLFVFTDISVYVSSDERHICYIYILNKGCIIFVHIRWDGWDENKKKQIINSLWFNRYKILVFRHLSLFVSEIDFTWFESLLLKFSRWL